MKNKEKVIRLRKKYSRFFKKHPKTDLNLVDGIRRFLRENILNYPKGIRITEISKALDEKRELVARRLSSMVKTGDANVAKGGRSQFFISEENKDGSYGEAYFGPAIGAAAEELIGDVEKIFTKNPELLDKQNDKYLKKVLNSRGSGKEDFYSLGLLVEYLWSKGFDDLVKLSPKNSANRYST
jgi:hypothetical protein